MSTFTKSALSLLALALAARAGEYAQFCESFVDGIAKDGCGKAVSTHNPGCLVEHGRHSLHFTEGESTLFYPVMVAYYDDNCQHEKGCNAIGKSGVDIDIGFDQQDWKFAEGANSFKFIHGSPANCPAGCVGQCGNAPASMRTRDRDAEIIAQAVNESAVSDVEDEHDLAKRQQGTNIWYCDDDNCSVNCGNKIEPKNPGCANFEYSRKSVFVKGLRKTKSVNLGGYDNNDCTGQPVSTIEAPDGCSKLPAQHESWDVIGFEI